MAVFEQERPCIHVSLLPGADAALYKWVEIGAEEEGVPCQLVTEDANEVVALAYKAALSSRFNIGVGVADDKVVLHELHMPAEQPVLAFKFSGSAEKFCRLMGSNAARMIVRKPFRFGDEAPPVATKRKPTANLAANSVEPVTPDWRSDPELIIKIITVIVRKLEERGIR
jgi:hypothetical protein